VASAPERFVEHLRDKGYHPRSSAHGNALCEFILDDLLDWCDKIADHASKKSLVYELNQKVIVGNSAWNIDLVLGSPPKGAKLVASTRGIAKARPATIRIAIEAKTVMTEHGKARRNRQRDLDSFHQFFHRYDADGIAAGITVVNVAPRFRSPLRPDVSIHRNVRTLVEGTLSLLRQLPSRSSAVEAGLEANGAVMVEHDNIDPRGTQLITASPAPGIGDPLHYETFIQRICDRYTQRWH
jgi:hypothetical protein